MSSCLPMSFFSIKKEKVSESTTDTITSSGEMCNPSVGPDKSAKSTESRGFLSKMSDTVDAVLSGYFGRLGAALGKSPYLFMLVSALDLRVVFRCLPRVGAELCLP